MNFLVIVLDTQRRDHLSCYGYPRKTSPQLDALAAEGVLCENCVTNTAHTMPSFTTMATGQDPSTHGIVGTLFSHPNEPDQRLDDTTPVLAEILRDNGYRTAAFDNLHDFGCYPSWFARGFHWYVNIWAPQGSHPCHLVASDLNEPLLPWLRQYANKQPWYLLLHYWDPHQPYNQPEPYRTMHTGGPEPEEVDVNGRGYHPHWGWTERLTDVSREKIDLYNGELSYVDNAVGEVFNILRETGVYDQTAIIVTADHGEDMEEHNAPFEHREPYETTVGVPLIFKPPAGVKCASGSRVSGIVGHIDLMPSVLDMASIDAPDNLDGKSWLPMARGEQASIHDALLLTGGATKQHGTWVSPELAIRTDEYKYIRRGAADYHEDQTWLDIACLCASPWRNEKDGTIKDKVDFFNSLPRRELYDLRTDRYETVNVADEHPHIVEQLDQRLRQFIAKNPRRLALEPLDDSDLAR